MSEIQASKQDVSSAMRFAKLLQEKYPAEVAIGVGVIIPNLVNGCSWGFVPDSNTEYSRYLEQIRSNQNMSSIKIRGGYLVNMDMGYLLSVLKDTAQGYITPQDLDYASQHRDAALLSLSKYLEKGVLGKIGIYNLNDTNSITINGVRFPAFCVTLPDLIAMCNRFGVSFKLGGTRRAPQVVSEHLLEVVSKLDLAPSSNAMFIEVCK